MLYGTCTTSHQYKVLVDRYFLLSHSRLKCFDTIILVDLFEKYMNVLSRQIKQTRWLQSLQSLQKTLPVALEKAIERHIKKCHFFLRKTVFYYSFLYQYNCSRLLTQPLFKTTAAFLRGVTIEFVVNSADMFDKFSKSYCKVRFCATNKDLFHFLFQV